MSSTRQCRRELAARGTLPVIEGERVHSDVRIEGVGEQMMIWAIAESRRQGCHLVQRTSDQARPGAHRFHQRPGFTDSPTGFKLQL